MNLCHLFNAFRNAVHCGRAAIAVMFLGGLVACGFHLRGVQSLPYATVAVTGNPSTTLAQLQQAVAAAPGTRLAGSVAEADVELQVLRESRDKIIIALSAAGRVREYELRLHIAYRLMDKQSNELIPTSEILLFRLLPYDESQVLSKGEEEVRLYRDMHADAVAQIMRRVATTKPK